jgi:hypothetical protein
MSIEKNTYYKLTAIGIEAVSAAETVLKQYPLTKIFLEILGKYLLDRIQFGIFAPGAEIIVQGTKGKDLFLICNHQVDVLVNTKQILQLQAPVLVGDKGIIDRESARKATILISAAADCLVIKIPMELFIRSFKKKNITDKEFTQEKEIYYQLFLEVQERLFKHSQIQKNLWEEINTGLHTLNSQLIVGTLNQKEEKEWGGKAWKVILRFLRSTFKINWPNRIPQNVKNLNTLLRQALDRNLPRSAFKGTDQQYAFKRQMVWKAWLNRLGDLLAKALPVDQLPISIGEVELFNPRIYQMRVSNLLRSIEHKFILKKVQPRQGTITPALLKASRFFGNKVKKHEFNLDAYTKAVNQQFLLKNPNRIMAQLTQQIAQLTATCENEFNASVSKMQHFLEKIKKLAFFESQTETVQADDAAVKNCVGILNQGFKAYHKRTVGHSHVHIGEVRFEKMGSPTITDLIKSCGSDHVRKKVEGANQSLISMLRLSGENFSDKQIGDLLHFCEAFPGDLVSSAEMSKHYWISISPGISLEKSGTPFTMLNPGTLIGGRSWDLAVDQEDDLEESWNLGLPRKKSQDGQSYMIGVIPKSSLPWTTNRSPLDEDFRCQHLPVIQWLLTLHLSHLVLMEQQRDLFFDRYAKISEVVVTEKKVREFESNKSMVSESDFNKITLLVMETVGLNLGKDPRSSSELLSKQIYNRILRQTKKGFPDLTIEEQGNKAYTLWRYMQSQIVMEVFIKGNADQVKLPPPKSVFELIARDVEQGLKKEFSRENEEGQDLFASPPEIDIKKIMQGARELMPDKQLEIALGVLQVLEGHLASLTNEARTYQERLKAISTIETEFDINEIQTRFISESIEKLQRTLYDKLPADSRTGSTGTDL